MTPRINGVRGKKPNADDNCGKKRGGAAHPNSSLTVTLTKSVIHVGIVVIIVVKNVVFLLIVVIAVSVDRSPLRDTWRL